MTMLAPAGYDPLTTLRRTSGANFSIPGIGQDIQSQVMGIVNPQLQQAADVINRRSTMGLGMIGGLTGAYAAHMGDLGPNPWEPEQAPLRKTAEWSRSSLIGSGQQQAGVQAAALKQMGPGIRGPGDVNLAQQGKGAGEAAYGTGIAELDAAIAKAAATQTRMALEPNFARMAGTQNESMFSAQVARQLADQQSSILSQVPELVMNLTQRQQDVTYRNQQAAEDRRRWEISRADDIRANKAKVVGPNAPTLQGRMAYWQAIAENRTKHDPHGYVYEGSYTGIHPVTDKKTGKPIVDPGFAAAQAQGLIPKSVKVTPGGTVGHYDKSGTFVTDYTAPNKPPTPGNLAYKNVLGKDGKVHIVALNPKTGKQVTEVGLAAPGTKAGTTAKMPTPGQTSGFVKSWYMGQTTKQQVGTDSNDNPIYKDLPSDTGKITYQEGYKKLRGMHYTDAQARSYLDTYWKRGERNRPWLSTDERAALKKAGLNPVVQYWQGNKDHPYIGPKQYAALQKAGMAPPADQRGGFYFIRRTTA